MVLTRLSVSLVQKRFKRVSRCFWASSSLLDSCSANSTTPKDPKTMRVHKKKERKKYSDLPAIYVSPTGAPAAPLGEWFAGADSDASNLSEFLPHPTNLQENLVSSPEPRTSSFEKKEKRRRPQRSQDENGLETRAVNSKNLKRKIQDSISVVPKLQSNASASTVIKPKAGGFLAHEILANLKRYPHCLLLTRVGQFYESYFDQAVEISRLLGIKLTSRKLKGERIAMCGFPLIHLDRHLKTLVQHEKRFVAMCEEFPRYTNSGTKEFDRRVSRIITPGTLIDESFLNPLENNYLVAISLSRQNDVKSPVGLAWIDVSTGEFFSERCTLESLQDELARLAPREIVLDSVFKTLGNHPIFTSLSEDSSCLIAYTSSTRIANPDDSENATTAPLSNKSLNEDDPTDLDSNVKQYIANLMDHMDYAESLAPEEASAINLLTVYLEETMLEHMPLLTSPLREGVQERMHIDAHTIKGLEIRENVYDGGTKGSLLSVLKRTVTNGGTRLLARWLCSPSTSITEIDARQSLVAFFSRRPHFRVDISETLKRVDDVGRLCQKFLLGRADFADLSSIHTSIEVWTNLGKQFQQEKAAESTERLEAPVHDEWKALDTLFSQLSSLDGLSNKISKAIFADTGDTKICDTDETDENITEEDTTLQPLFPDKDSYKWVINPNFSEKLSSLHTLFENMLKEKEKLERELQLKYDAPSLTVRSSSGQAMFVHLAKAKRDKKGLDLDPDFHDLMESGSTKDYFYRPWSELGNKLAETSIAIALAEKEVLQMLRLEIIQHSSQLRQNAQVIDELDVLLSFATLATEMNFVQPVMMDNDSYKVVNGRHPSVEMGLLSSGRQFTPNSVEMTSSSNLHIITGPNMAGKSTFLRQTALIAILAQVGSFVPADSAHIGVVDRLFSRIGAKDDLFRDRSTFMVEMIETADILRRATPKSLVIMDEVGRGTTVKDGLAISFATLHHLASINRSRCLFATHFHELANMVSSDNENEQRLFRTVRFYCSDINDTEDGHFTYSYRLRPGINCNSHGLKVAQLAGMPAAAMTVAEEALLLLKEKHL